MNSIYQHYIIDLSSNNNFVQIPAVQGDGNGTRGLEVELIQNGTRYTIDTDDTLVCIMGTKPDTKEIMNDCTVSPEGYILIDITSQMSAVEGRGDYQVVLMDRKTNSQLKSFPFHVLTTPASFDIGYVTSSDEFQTLTGNIFRTEEVIEEANGVISDMRGLEESVEGAENARVRAEAERANAEENRRSAESARVSNENVRNQNEENRENAETDRTSAENSRASAESIRESNENSRTSNENTRKANEADRENAETLRTDAESGRAEAETERAAAENTREISERERETAEADRGDAENLRSSNEEARQGNEAARQTAEAARQADTSAAIADAGRAAEQAEAAADRADKAAEACEDMIGSISIATTQKAGIVKPDGKTIRVESDGTIIGAASGFTGTAAEAEQALINGEIEDGDIVNITDDYDETVTVDKELSAASENPVQNKAVYAAITQVTEALGGMKLVTMTQAEYEALDSHDAGTLYITT